MFYIISGRDLSNIYLNIVHEIIGIIFLSVLPVRFPENIRLRHCSRAILLYDLS